MSSIAEKLTEVDAHALCDSAYRDCHERPDDSLRSVARARAALTAFRSVGPDTLRLLARLAEAAAWSTTHLCRLNDADRELRTAREINQRLKADRGLAECELISAYLADRRGLLVDAAEASQRAVLAFERIDDREGIARSQNAAGLVTTLLGDFRAALQFFESARKQADQAGDAVTKSFAISNIGWVFLCLEHLEDAQRGLVEGLDACRAAANRRGVATALRRLGEVHDRRGNLDESIDCLREACQIYSDLKDPEGESFSRINLVRVHGKLGNWPGSRKEYEAVELLVRPSGLRRCSVNAKYEFAQILLLQAICDGSPEGPGLSLMKEALRDAGLAGFRPEQCQIHEALWRHHKQHGHFAEALEHHEQLSRLRRELHSTEAEAQAARLRVLHEVERSRGEAEAQRQRAEELAALNAEIDRQRSATEALSKQLQEKVGALEHEISLRQKAEEDRLALERQMMETQKIESLGVLASAIAHDFNNLLTVIVGNADLARLKSGTAQVHQSLDAILSASARAATLCQQMLEFAGKGNSHRVPLELAPLVRESLDLAASAFAPSCSARSEVQANLPQVEADAGQLRQVIVNLLFNASEAIGKNAGEIVVSLTRCVLDAKRASKLRGAAAIGPGEFLCIEVKDTGPGMTPDVLQRVFEPFFSTRFLGRGLGLPAALGIIRAHSGGIEIDSAPGRGTAVRVFLPPIAQQTTKAVTPPLRDGNEEWQGSGLVLVADDEASLREIVVAACERFGFSVITASDGAEALARFRENEHRIVAALLDFQMPHYDGAFICRRILQARPGLPVILMSGFLEQAPITQLTADYPDVVFLPKPFGIAKLRQLFQATLSRAS
ncbi:hypothetical protein DB347_12345 [Opitutaceae bacterium EW11]|nr:hypothetical protein DB347_12345 [Opitutaceae bacterium EW11]